MAVITIKDHSGGVNQHSAPTLINNNQSPMAVNISLDQDGNVAHRLGSDLLLKLADGTKYQGHETYNKSDGTHTIVVAFDGDLYKYNESTGAFDSIDTSVFGATSTVEFVNYLDRLYFIGSGATEYLSYYDGSSITVVSGNIAGKFLATGNDRIVVAGDSRRAYYSNVGNDTFTIASDYIDFDYDQTAIQSLGEANPFIGFDEYNLYVFDPNSSYSRKIPTFGCSSHRSVQIIQGHAVFLGRNGFFRFSAAESYPTKISTPIEDFVNYDAVFSKMTTTNFTGAAAVVKGNKYFCSIGNLSSTVKGQTLNDLMVVFDLKQQTLYFNTYTAGGIGAGFSLWIDTNGVENIIVGSRDGTALLKIEVPDLYTDDDLEGTTNAVNALYRTKFLEFSGGRGNSFSGVEVTKNLEELFVKLYASSSGLTLKYAKDGATTYTDWKSLTATPSGKDWHWIPVTAFTNPIMTSLSLEFSGTGKWILDTFSLNLYAGTTLNKTRK